MKNQHEIKSKIIDIGNDICELTLTEDAIDDKTKRQ